MVTIVTKHWLFKQYINSELQLVKPSQTPLRLNALNLYSSLLPNKIC